MKPAAPSVLRVARLLDQVRERIRYKHYSLRTEQAYLQWVPMFVKLHGLQHPRDIGREEIESFLAVLANQRRAAKSTHNHASLGHSDVRTTMINSHVLKVATGGTTSPLDAMASNLSFPRRTALNLPSRCQLWAQSTSSQSETADVQEEVSQRHVPDVGFTSETGRKACEDRRLSYGRCCAQTVMSRCGHGRQQPLHCCLLHQGRGRHSRWRVWAHSPTWLH